MKTSYAGLYFTVGNHRLRIVSERNLVPSYGKMRDLPCRHYVCELVGGRQRPEDPFWDNKAPYSTLLYPTFLMNHMELSNVSQLT